MGRGNASPTLNLQVVLSESVRGEGSLKQTPSSSCSGVMSPHESLVEKLEFSEEKKKPHR